MGKDYNFLKYNPNVQKREYQYDNIRFILIFLVVFGHCLELFNSGIVYNIYRIIYSFHMPLFIYLSGIFARFNPKRIFKHYVIPYFIFQTIYLLFDSFILKNNDFTLQYTTPYWILWYLMTIIVYNLLLPAFPKMDFKWSITIFIFTTVAALIVGFDKTIGYYMSLSRIIVFFPFFILGYNHEAIRHVNIKISKIKRVAIFILVSSVVVLGELYFWIFDIPAQLMYSSSSFSACSCTVLDRLLFMMTAVGCIVLALMIIPKKKMGLISILGQNTMPVFLLHAFVIRLLGKNYFFHFLLPINVLLSFGVALLLVFVFGNPFMGKIFKKVF